ncbi:MAG TPA: PAS domain S-box protein [Candidatus Limnocylindrales bacterium]|nr:PAS domain S-box protein [Candidatus Limnocylindrales bacterium]
MPSPSSPARPFDASAAALVVVDRDFRVRGLNRAAEQAYGLTEADALGQPVNRLFTVSYLDGTIAGDVVAALERGGAWSGRVAQVLEDGRTRIVDTMLVSVAAESGEALTYAFSTPAPEADVSAEDVSHEGRFRSLFERLPDALLVQELDGRIIDANEAAARLYGFARWELVRQHARAVTADLDEPTVERMAHEIEERGWTIRRGIGRRSDGTTFPQEATITRVTVGGRGAAFVLVRDLTELLRVEAELASLTDLARLHEASGSLREVAGGALDLVRRALQADRGALGIFDAGGHLEWLAQERMEEFTAAIPDLHTARQVPWLPRILETGHAEFVDRRDPGRRTSIVSKLADRMGMAAYAVVPLRAGEELTGALGLVWSGDPPAQARHIQLLDTIGRLTGMAIANVQLRDTLVTRQHALDESEARYRALFRASPEAILIESADGRVVDANPAASALYGRSVDELVGLEVDELAALEADGLAQIVDQLRRDGGGRYRGTGIRADGSTFPTEVDIARAFIEGEERFIVNVRDLTEHERLQAELLQAQKMEALGQLVSGVAHELNNPLSAIVAFSQLMRLDERLPQDLLHDADLLMQEAERTRRIVQNLLDFARQRRPERRAANVGQLLDRTLELQSYAIGGGKISAELDIPAELPPVDVDPSQIQQVLLNLTMNAIQALGERDDSGHLWISAHTVGGTDGEGERVEVRFSDDGPGVAPEHRERLFEPFFTTKKVGEGTGLGLSVSYGIVASHGGRLWYEPRPEGGSTFVLELPVARGGAHTAPPPRLALEDAVTQRRRGGVVLVVDDEPSIRAFLERILVRAGHEVTVAADGTDGLAAVERSAFDVVLCDHRMGGMDGLQCYDRAIAIRPELRGRIVLMSGDVLNPTLRSFAEQRGLRLLAKPFDLDAILDTVDEIIARD